MVYITSLPVSVGIGRIKIQDILACGFLDDLLELRDDDLSKEQQEANWFSAPSALRVYGGRGTQSLTHSHTFCNTHLVCHSHWCSASPPYVV